MAYERTRQIEQRFLTAVNLIKRKRLDAPKLAVELGVSQPTARRIVAELKRRGYGIRSVNDGRNWSYELNSSPERVNTRHAK